MQIMQFGSVFSCGYRYLSQTNKSFYYIRGYTLWDNTEKALNFNNTFAVLFPTYPAVICDIYFVFFHSDWVERSHVEEFKPKDNKHNITTHYFCGGSICDVINL